MSTEQNNRLGNRTVNRLHAGRKSCLPQGIISAALAAFLAFSLGTAGPAQADQLDDRKEALEQEISEVEHSLEFLDADIIETVKQLKEYQSQLPAAQRSLLPVAIGITPAPSSAVHAARSSSQVAGGLTPASANSALLYQSTLVTSAE